MHCAVTYLHELVVEAKWPRLEVCNRNPLLRAGHDVPFVNNYGVWKDEFRELGLESTLDVSWEDATCWFGEGQQVRVGRGYGRCLAVFPGPAPLPGQA